MCISTRKQRVRAPQLIKPSKRMVICPIFVDANPNEKNVSALSIQVFGERYSAESVTGASKTNWSGQMSCY